MITLSPCNMPNEWQQNQINRKFGMFIHFGINTFNDTEWSDGTLPLSSYNPTEIDADGWVRNAYMAGMEYVIIITKHHDGFCMYDTKFTDYSVNNTVNNTDVVMAVGKACAKYGIKLGLYYSLWDRHEPCYKDDEKYVDFMCNQLTELLDGRYGDVCELWLDGGWDKRPKQWDIPRLYDLIHTLQPCCSVGVNLSIGNKRRKKGQKRFQPQNYKENMPIKYFPSDFRLWDPLMTREGNLDPKIYKYDKKQYYLPFEATLCIRNMSNWFWDPKYNSEKLIEAQFIADKYKHLTEQNNVMVVNLAPDITGKQVQSDLDRLFEASKILGIYRDIDKK